MNIERKIGLRDQALRYAMMCDECNLSLLELFEQMYKVPVVWKQLTDLQIEASIDPNKITDKKGVSLLLGEYPGDCVLSILTRQVAADNVRTYFVVIHELAHWILGHAKLGYIKYSEYSSEEEREASYFSLALLTLSEHALDNHYPKRVADDELISLGVDFVNFIGSSEEWSSEVEKLSYEVEEIKKWAKDYDNKHV